MRGERYTPAAYRSDKEPMNQAVEPCVDPPTPPIWLRNKGREEWDRIVPQLIQMRVLTPIDVINLATYCETYSQWLKCREVLENEGMWINLGDERDTGRAITVRKHPAVDIADRLLRAMLLYSKHFGLSPHSRAAIKAPRKQSADEDDFDKFVADDENGFAGKEASIEDDEI